MTRVAGSWRTALPHAWSVVLPLLLLGPALGPGYVLSYDMVWVPQLAMRSDFLGAGGGLPRAVPSDAVVAVLDNVIPGMVLQKIVLLGALLLVGQGVLRMVGTGVAARLTAVSVAVWNPFVVERLWIGHWPVLLGYAVLPWLVVLLRRPAAAEPARFPPALWFLVPVGCLSASAGAMTALTLLVLGVRRAPRGYLVRLVVLAVAGNAPWLVAGLLHVPDAGAGVRSAVFALHGEGSMPAPLAALTMGGIWNSEVVPASRTGVMGWVALVGIGLLALLGLRTWWRRTSRNQAVRLVALWGTGYAVAVLTWLSPDLVDTLAQAVPGAGLARDGGRYLALCLPLLAALTASGAQTLSLWLESSVPCVAAVVACTLLPVMVMTDAAGGIGGALRPASYPETWSNARADLAAARQRTGGGDLLVLPFSSYRAPQWNGGRKVLDPLGRFLTPDYLVDDDLTVSGIRVPGDDPRTPRVAALLAQDDTAAQSRGLARLGVRFVAADLDADGGELRSTPLPTGTVVFADDEIEVVRLSGNVHTRHHPWAWWGALAAGWVAFLATFLAGFLAAATGLARRLRRRRGSSLRRC